MDLMAWQQPYGSWVKRQLLHLDDYLAGRPPADVTDVCDLTRQQVAFGCTSEELQLVLRTMAGEGHEPTWSMGDDTALSVLSTTPRSVSAFFKPEVRPGHEPADRSDPQKRW